MESRDGRRKRDTGSGYACGQGQHGLSRRWRRARGGASPQTRREGRGSRPRGGRSGRAPVTVTTASAEPERPGAGRPRCPPMPRKALRCVLQLELRSVSARAALPARLSRAAAGRRSRSWLFRHRFPPRVPLPAAAPRSRPGRFLCGCSGPSGGRLRLAFQPLCVGILRQRPRAGGGSRRAPPQLLFSCGKVVGGVRPCAAAFPLLLATAMPL